MKLRDGGIPINPGTAGTDEPGATVRYEDGDLRRPVVAERGGKPPSGVELIAAERQRQIWTEGWTAEHDAAHTDGELARDASWWKPSTPVRDLVKAGALIAAELDRLLAIEGRGGSDALPSESPIPEGFPVVGCPSCSDLRYHLWPTDGIAYACAKGHKVDVEEFQRLLNQSRTRRDDARMEADRQAAIGRFWDKIVPPETPGVIDVQEIQKSLEALVSGTPAEVTAEWDRLAAGDGLAGQPRIPSNQGPPLLRKHEPTIHLQDPSRTVSGLLLEDREPHSLPGAGAFDSGHRDTAERAEEILAGESEGEARYSAGRRMAYVQMLRFALRGLGVDDPEAAGARWAVERAELLNVLRDACGRFGDNDWPDDLHLADVIDKHLLCYMNED